MRCIRGLMVRDGAGAPPHHEGQVLTHHEDLYSSRRIGDRRLPADVAAWPCLCRARLANIPLVGADAWHLRRGLANAIDPGIPGTGLSAAFPTHRRHGTSD